MPDFGVCPTCGSRLEVVGTVTRYFVPCDAVKARRRVDGLAREIATLDQFHHNHHIYVDLPRVELAIRRWLEGPEPYTPEGQGQG